MRLSRLLPSLLLCCFNVQAQTESLKIVTGELPPYSYTQNGQQAGVGTDIVDEIKRRTACTIKIESRPWKRVMAESGGHQQLIYPLARTPAREAHFKWIGPFLKDKLIFAVRAADPRVFSGVEDFRTLTIGVNNGAATETRLKELGFQKIDLGSSEKINLSKLLNRRFDAWFTSVMLLESALTNSGHETRDVKIAASDVEIQLYIAASLDIDDRTVLLWQKTLDSMKADGSYQSIMDKNKPHWAR